MFKGRRRGRGKRESNGRFFFRISARNDSLLKKGFDCLAHILSIFLSLSPSFYSFYFLGLLVRLGSSDRFRSQPSSILVSFSPFFFFFFCFPSIIFIVIISILKSEYFLPTTHSQNRKNGAKTLEAGKISLEEKPLEAARLHTLAGYDLQP